MRKRNHIFPLPKIIKILPEDWDFSSLSILFFSKKIKFKPFSLPDLEEKNFSRFYSSTFSDTDYEKRSM